MITDDIVGSLRESCLATIHQEQPMEFDETSKQQLVFLNTHWGRKHSFAAAEATRVAGAGVVMITKAVSSVSPVSG